ncbi:MAG: hypothetical protein GX363_08645 [Clostridiales bacterium]|jgi:hypothetical protein|nr:hypothetical protein [Clostridiales bacterium]
MSDIKERIIEELDSRIERLRDHQYKEIVVTGNQYEELNQALSKVIGAPLLTELESIKDFVEKL